MLVEQANKGKHFEVIVTEGRPDGTGLAFAKILTEANIKGASLVNLFYILSGPPKPDGVLYSLHSVLCYHILLPWIVCVCLPY